MKPFNKILVIVVIATFLSSCGSAQKTINDLQGLNNELKYNSGDFSVDDWNDAKERLDKIQEKVKKYDFSDDQLREIGALTASCYVYMGKNTVKSTFKDVRDVIIQAQGAAEEIKSIVEDAKQKKQK